VSRFGLGRIKQAFYDLLSTSTAALKMEIDHVFVFVGSQGDEVKPFQSLGLVETYRRQHAGQGTQNVCFCFDNLFLELLWVSQADEVRSEKIARTKLAERSQWKTNGANPFGIAWRGPQTERQAIPTWQFRPPYLPEVHIEVATDSDDPRQPMMFHSPGGEPPINWPLEKRGSLQHAGGFGKVSLIELAMPKSAPASAALQSIADQTFLRLVVSDGSQFAMRLYVEKPGSSTPLVVELPI
jgi:Glyoxalase-like domain